MFFDPLKRLSRGCVKSSQRLGENQRVIVLKIQEVFKDFEMIPVSLEISCHIVKRLEMIHTQRKSSQDDFQSCWDCPEALCVSFT